MTKMSEKNEDSVRIFRISLYYKHMPNKKIKNWLYQDENAWKKELSNKKTRSLSMLGTCYLSEELIDGKWVQIEDWQNWI